MSGNEASRCACAPCETPGRGHPGIEHCAACCGGSLIEEYDHECPIAEHRDMANRQFPPATILGGAR